MGGSAQTASWLRTAGFGIVSSRISMVISMEGPGAEKAPARRLWIYECINRSNEESR